MRKTNVSGLQNHAPVVMSVKLTPMIRSQSFDKNVSRTHTHTKLHMAAVEPSFHDKGCPLLHWTPNTDSFVHRVTAERRRRHFLNCVPEDLGTAVQHHIGRKSCRDPGRKLAHQEEPDFALQQGPGRRGR